MHCLPSFFFTVFSSFSETATSTRMTHLTFHTAFSVPGLPLLFFSHSLSHPTAHLPMINTYVIFNLDFKCLFLIYLSLIFKLTYHSSPPMNALTLPHFYWTLTHLAVPISFSELSTVIIILQPPLTTVSLCFLGIPTCQNTTASEAQRSAGAGHTQEVECYLRKIPKTCWMGSLQIHDHRSQHYWVMQQHFSSKLSFLVSAMTISFILLKSATSPSQPDSQHRIKDLKPVTNYFIFQSPQSGPICSTVLPVELKEQLLFIGQPQYLYVFDNISSCLCTVISLSS